MVQAEEYAANCLRGIRRLAQIDQYGLPVPEVFYFHESNVRDSDDLIAESINWEDDDQAMPFTLLMEHVDGEDKGQIQFEGGVAILPKTHLDSLGRLDILSGAFSYDREPQDPNGYHGNLLLRRDIPSRRMKRLAAMLAECVIRVEPQPPAATTPAPPR